MFYMRHDISKIIQTTSALFLTNIMLVTMMTYLIIRVERATIATGLDNIASGLTCAATGLTYAVTGLTYAASGLASRINCISRDVNFKEMLKAFYRRFA